MLRNDAFDDPKKIKRWIATRKLWRSPTLVIGVVVAFYAIMFATGGMARWTSRRYSANGLILLTALAIVFGERLMRPRGAAAKLDHIDALTPEDLLTVVAWVVMLGAMAFQIWLRLEGKI